MNASTWRDTRFEIENIKQGANDWVVTLSQRPAKRGAPPITVKVDESRFTPEQLKVIHEAFRAIEEVVGVMYEEWHADDASRAHETIAAALQKKEELEKLEASIIDTKKKAAAEAERLADEAEVEKKRLALEHQAMHQKMLDDHKAKMEVLASEHLAALETVAASKKKAEDATSPEPTPAPPTQETST